MSRKLRDAARGKPCMVRIPGVCNGDPETTVGAHLRVTGTCGVGQKPPDILMVYACSSCHDEIDRRTHYCDAEQVKLWALEALARQLADMWERGEINL